MNFSLNNVPATRLLAVDQFSSIFEHEIFLRLCFKFQWKNVVSAFFYRWVIFSDFLSGDQTQTLPGMWKQTLTTVI